jgi:hypothetical protein
MAGHLHAQLDLEDPCPVAVIAGGLALTLVLAAGCGMPPPPAESLDMLQSRPARKDVDKLFGAPTSTGKTRVEYAFYRWRAADSLRFFDAPAGNCQLLVEFGQLGHVSSYRLDLQLPYRAVVLDSWPTQLGSSTSLKSCVSIRRK